MTRHEIASRLMDKVKNELINTSGSYPNLDMDGVQASMAINHDLYRLDNSVSANDDEDVKNEYRRLKRQYYGITGTGPIGIEHVRNSEKFKADCKNNLDTPGYGELLWHYYKDLTTMLLPDLDMHYQLQYRFRRQIHALSLSQDAMEKVAITAAEFTTTLQKMVRNNVN